MSLPMTAIDAQADYDRWVQQYLWHIDQVAPLLDSMHTLALPRIGVSRGGSQFDRPQITGGGYYDAVPLSDSGAGNDAHDLWFTFWLYLHDVAFKASTPPPLASHMALWRTIPTSAPDHARAHAIEAAGWLAELVDQIIDWPDLSSREDELFATIRRMRRRYTATTTVRRQRPRLCQVCGEHAVVIDWIDGHNGSPKPVQVGLCRSCRQVYEAPLVAAGEEATA